MLKTRQPVDPEGGLLNLKVEAPLEGEVAEKEQPLVHEAPPIHEPLIVPSKPGLGQPRASSQQLQKPEQPIDIVRPTPPEEQAHPEAPRILSRGHEFRQSTFFEGRDRLPSPAALDSKFFKKKKLRTSVFIKSHKAPSAADVSPP